MPSTDDARFGEQMVTIFVGPGKERFCFYKNTLTADASYLFCALFTSDLDETDTTSAERDQADLPGELPETIQAFMNWIYPAFIGFSLRSLPPSDNTVALFQLYGFGYRYLVSDLQDAIVSVLYKKFASDIDLWFTLGSNKLALETFHEEVPSGTYLYSLVVRFFAYSVRLRSEDPWSEFRPALPATNFSSTAATESRVAEVMESIPSQLLGPILKEVLLMKTVGDWKQGFCSIVGWESKFLKRCEGLPGW